MRSDFSIPVVLAFLSLSLHPPTLSAQNSVNHHLADGQIGWDVARPISVDGQMVGSGRAMLFRDTMVIKNVAPGAFVNSPRRAGPVWVEKGSLILTLDVSSVELAKLRTAFDLVQIVHPPTQVVDSREEYREEQRSFGVTAGGGGNAGAGGNAGGFIPRFGFSATVASKEGSRAGKRTTRVITHSSLEELKDSIVDHYDVIAMSASVYAPVSGYVYFDDEAGNSVSLPAGARLAKIEIVDVVRGHMWLHLNRVRDFKRGDFVTVTFFGDSVHDGVITEVGIDPCTDIVCQAYAYVPGDTMSQRLISEGRAPARTKVTIQGDRSLAKSLEGISPLGTAIMGVGRIFKRMRMMTVPRDAVVNPGSDSAGVFLAVPDRTVGNWAVAFKSVDVWESRPADNLDPDYLAVEGALDHGDVVLRGRIVDTLVDGDVLGPFGTLTTQDCMECPRLMLLPGLLHPRFPTDSDMPFLISVNPVTSREFEAYRVARGGDVTQFKDVMRAFQAALVEVASFGKVRFQDVYGAWSDPRPLSLSEFWVEGMKKGCVDGDIGQRLWEERFPTDYEIKSLPNTLDEFEYFRGRLRDTDYERLCEASIWNWYGHFDRARDPQMSRWTSRAQPHGTGFLINFGPVQRRFGRMRLEDEFYVCAFSECGGRIVGAGPAADVILEQWMREGIRGWTEVVNLPIVGDLGQVGWQRRREGIVRVPYWMAEDYMEWLSGMHGHRYQWPSMLQIATMGSPFTSGSTPWVCSQECGYADWESGYPIPVVDDLPTLMPIRVIRLP